MRVFLMTGIVVALSWVMLGAVRAAEPWPDAAVNILLTICYQKSQSDVPAANLDFYCECIADRTPKAVSWGDWALVDWAVRLDGVRNLNDHEKDVMNQVLNVR